MSGKIRIGQQSRGNPYPSYSNFETIPAWSRGAGKWKQLSPFYLKMQENVIFENFWQSHKVWEKVDKQKTVNWTYPAEIHVDLNGEPNSNWFKWHNKLKYHDLPVRRPNGRNIPLYSYWVNNKKLNLIESRKEIYIPYLKQIYRATPVYYELLDKLKKGKNIMIVEPDGPLYESYKNGLEVN